MKHRLIAFLSLLWSPLAFAAPGEAFKPATFGLDASAQGKPEVMMDLVSEVTSPAPGVPFAVAFRFEHSGEWHTYWKNSGYVEQPAKVSWTLPDGFTAGPLLFPIPERSAAEGRSSYHYAGTSYLVTMITPASNVAAGTEVTLEAAVNYQYCKEGNCVPKKEKKTLKLQMAGTPVPNPDVAGPLSEYRASHFPKAFPSSWQVSATKRGSKMALQVSGPEVPQGAVEFYPADNHIASKESYPVSRENGTITITLPLDAEKEGALQNLPGLFVVASADPFKAPVAYELNPPITIGSAATSEVGGMTLSYTLLLAFVGGLILNLMPCVFPVIGLKIMGFVRQAGQDRKKILLHGLVFSAGVLVCFWALSGTLLWLRSRGEQVGWGFQLQSPWVVYGLMILMFAFALNMFGVFEIGTSAVGVGQELTAKQGLSGTFFSGLLAVIVATPCSAPFLAPALGAALTLPPISFFSVFSMVGVGLALPYLLLSAFPGLLKKLPKPGAWMEAFKQIMSFLLFMTAGYLLWVYGGLTAAFNESNQLYAILGLGLIGMGAYIYGRWCPPVHSGKTRAISGLLALGLVAGGIFMGSPKKDALKWEPWSQERVDELRAQGVPVYIDFTAKWCATCQTNKLSYKSKEIVRMVEEKKIAMLKADWTDENPKITEALAGYGRSAIPVNVLYIPGQEEPEVLPNLLTTDVVLSYWNKVPMPATK